MKTVLFVCVGNSARSQIAEGFFTYLAPPGWQALSAGTAPASEVSKDAVSVMKEKGIDIRDSKPKLLSEGMLRKADHIISMGCGVDLCPYELYEGVVDWAFDDPNGMVIQDLRGVRDEIEKRVTDLIRTLA